MTRDRLRLALRQRGPPTGPYSKSLPLPSLLPSSIPYRPQLAWMPMEEERPNENASALPENSGIFALSAPWSLCGSKSYRGVSREVIRSIVYSAFVDQLSFRPGKIGIRRS